jgi:hypothetical protein
MLDVLQWKKVALNVELCVIKVAKCKQNNILIPYIITIPAAANKAIEAKIVHQYVTIQTI